MDAPAVQGWLEVSWLNTAGPMVSDPGCFHCSYLGRPYRDGSVCVSVCLCVSVHMLCVCLCLCVCVFCVQCLAQPPSVVLDCILSLLTSSLMAQPPAMVPGDMEPDVEPLPADIGPDGPTICLRELLDEDEALRFQAGGIADAPVKRAQLDLRPSAIQRGLVAHSALCQALRMLDPTAQPPRSLAEAIDRALVDKVIHRDEVGWLKHINATANEAKHVFD